ncbi:MAG: bifunctional phosphopantothenoylcysteine decarboxylase/phosphopantothenate--cysteine ligase CoaBC [bacterium]
MNSNIIFGITGSIAAYKACELIRKLKSLGCDIHPVMTKQGKKFITPLTIATLSGNPVSTKPSFHMEHIKKCDLIIIAPASGNIIGKIASGIADSLLTSIALAMKAPIIIAPAMNEGMYLNPITQRNIKTLKENGIIVIEPEKGKLAEGEGYGRLADIEKIVDEAISLLKISKIASSKRVLITAGGTKEPIDPIRFVSNRSSGIMGHSLAERFSLFGADTTLITTTSIPTPSAIKRYEVQTASEMKEMVNKTFKDCDIFVSTAAVCDFRPQEKITSKIKDKEITLKLTRNPDILEEAGKRKKHQKLIGFSVDTENRLKEAKKKIREKNLDFIVVCAIPDFARETIKPTILYKDGNIEEFNEISKREFADCLIKRVTVQPRINTDRKWV